MQAAYLARYGKWLPGRSVGGDHDGVQLAKTGLGERLTEMEVPSSKKTTD